jgi:hypothetical protein
VATSKVCALGELVDLWLEDIAPHRSPYTMCEYRRITARTISPGSRRRPHRQDQWAAPRQFLQEASPGRPVQFVGPPTPLRYPCLARPGGQMGVATPKPGRATPSRAAQGGSSRSARWWPEVLEVMPNAPFRTRDPRPRRRAREAFRGLRTSKLLSVSTCPAALLWPEPGQSGRSARRWAPARLHDTRCESSAASGVTSRCETQVGRLMLLARDGYGGPVGS